MDHLTAIGGRLAPAMAVSPLSMNFFTLFFALVILHHVKDLLSDCYPLRSLRIPGQSTAVWYGIEPHSLMDN